MVMDEGYLIVAEKLCEEDADALQLLVIHLEDTSRWAPWYAPCKRAGDAGVFPTACAGCMAMPPPSVVHIFHSVAVAVYSIL